MNIEAGTVIGWRVLAEPQTFDIPQEYAGACVQVEVPAGRYPIVLRKSYCSPGRFEPYCAMSGVVAYDHFVNRLWGHSSTSRNDHKGEPQTYHWSPYMHGLAWAMIRGQYSDVEFAPGVEAREYTHKSYDGRVLELAGIFIDGEQVEGN